ncbi:MAG: hypothetical protein HQL31_04245 [Planctomycetes bacterium]|nr:hypothetical protein [Planctomycetota bacterium]
MNSWDWTLIAVVSVMGTAVAYLRNPEHKAFVLMLPVPFTLAVLTLDRPVSATHVLAMLPSFAFTIGVWALHVRLRWPILAAIVFCALAYCALGISVERSLPASEGIFWMAAAFTFTTSFLLILTLPYRSEPHHRSPLPVWIKLPAIALVVFFLVAIKQRLGGFMTMFPMVGVVAAYEARNCLWALVRRFPWLMLLMTPMMVLIHLTQAHVGQGWALALGWLLHLLLLWLLRNRYGRGALPLPFAGEEISPGNFQRSFPGFRKEEE